MRRRDFIHLLGGAAAAWPVTARAQRPDRLQKLGVLMSGPESDSTNQSVLRTARDTLRNLGWTEGRNIELHVRWARADEGLRRRYAAELVGLAPNAILTYTAPTTIAVMRETAIIIPIVFASGADPVVSGIVSNLARPGGNVTGFSATEPSLGGKWFNLLNEMLPNARRVAVVEPPENPALSEYRHAIDDAIRGRLERINIDAREDVQIEREIEAFARTRGGMLLVIPGASTAAHRNAIISAAAKHQLPAIYPNRPFAADGGLMTYGADTNDLFHRAATYIDRILRGEKAGDLPVQLPTKFELVINLRTAKELDLAVPNTLLVSATEVIE